MINDVYDGDLLLFHFGFDNFSAICSWKCDIDHFTFVLPDVIVDSLAIIFFNRCTFFIKSVK